MKTKTPLRLLIEEFLNDKDEFKDDWLSIPYANTKMKNKIYSTITQMKISGFNFAEIENDHTLNVVWIRRPDDNLSI